MAVMMNVFQYLPYKERAKAATVCKDWWHAYNAPELWQEFSLASAQDAGAQFDTLMPVLRERFARHLRRVSLQFAVGITDLHVVQLRQFSALTELNLNACHGLTENGIQSVLPSLANLDTLSLYWLPCVTDNTLFIIAAFNTQLTKLVLSGCQHVSDIGVATLAQACTKLVHLDLTRCVAVSHNACEALSQNCTALQTLLMYADAALDDTSIQAVGKLKDLRIVDLCGARLVTDAGLVALSACTCLTSLNLTWCPQLTDASVCPVASTLGKLRTLSLHGNTHITDSVLDALVQSCSGSLTALDVSGCIKMQHRSQEELLKRLPKLKCFKIHS